MFLIYSKTCKNKISKTKVLVNRPTFLPTRDQQVADSIPVRRSAMGGAADFKVGGGYKTAAREKKICTPHFFKCGDTSTSNLNISTN